MASEEGRTFWLDKALVRDLASPDIELRDEAMSQLPEALSRADVSGIAIQVSLVPGAEAIRQGERLGKEVLFYLGCTALIRRDDLVTAGSVANELRARGDLVGFVILSYELRKAKRNIVNNMLATGPTDS
ncbi:MAG TPA: hypothetical protein VNE40_00925 [Candidatus Dormibacteraeota bacterium]|nr:hypothetical protein [Candidatus Dormibacteraeota bacterium]